MRLIHKGIRGAVAALALTSLAACSSAGGLGNILGSVLGGQQAQNGQVSGTVQGVDTRNQQIGLQTSNGQSIAVAFDNNTRVVFQNQNYAVTNLERGDQVTVRLQQLQNGGYYTDMVQVDQSVSGANSSQGTALQSIEGNVRRIDQANGLFTVDASNNVSLVVSIPAGLGRADVQRFQSLRAGDYVRFYAVFVTNSRVELRRFY